MLDGMMLRIAPVALLASLGSAQHAEVVAPHIVLILADDLGWTDLSTGLTNGGHGSDYYRTPHLDALATSGTCFTQGYSSAPNCAPTRAALWSGRWAPRTGIYTVASGNRGRKEHRKLVAAANEKVLDPEFVTLAERLDRAGYDTGHFGKWHLGDGPAAPMAQGFDVAAGGDHRGGVGSKGHFSEADGSFPLPNLGAVAVAPTRQFLADRLTDEALAWMAGCEGPTFCCLSHYSVHTPIQAPADAIEAAGEASADARHRHRKYAAMVANLDANVGRVLEWLRNADDPVRPGRKRIDNTLIVFTSDNGGLGGYATAGIAGGEEITSQLPLRSGKGSLHEGGVRVPYIVSWPGRVRVGATDPTPIQTIDLYPTLLALAGGEADANTDGADVSARFRLEPGAVAERPLIWHFPGYLQANSRRGTWRTTPGTVVRLGDLKLMWWYEIESWALYDLAADLGEDRNLAEERPEDVRRLGRVMIDWLEATKAPRPTTPAGELCGLPVL